MFKKTRGFATFVVLLGSACVTSSEPTESQELGSGATGNKLVETTNNQVRLLAGYDPLYDQVRGSCLKPAGEAPDGHRRIQVSALGSSVNHVYVWSREQLAEQLGVDLGLKASYGIAKGSGALGLLNVLSENRNSLNVLTTVAVDYAVSYHPDAPLALIGDAENGPLKALTDGPESWDVACGPTYAAGVNYGARYYQLIVYKAKDEKAANGLKAEFGLEAGVEGKAGIDAKGAVKNQSDRSSDGIETTVYDSVFGFEMTQSEGAGISGTILPGTERAPAPPPAVQPAPATEPPAESPPADGEAAESPPATAATTPPPARDPSGSVKMQPKAKTLEQIEAIRGVMQKSAKRDMCIDNGDASCAGVNGAALTPDADTKLGYAQRTLTRLVRVVGVTPGNYKSVSNFHVNGNDPIIKIRQARTRQERYLRAYTRLQLLMEKVYSAEIEPFLNNPDENQKAFYNVAPPGKPRTTTDEVVKVASYWALRFGPEGTDLLKVKDLIDDCWQDAEDKFNHECWNEQEDEENPREESDWKALDRALKNYRDTGRVVQMRVQVSQNSSKGNEAARDCAVLGSNTDPYELPTPYHIEALGPLVRTGPVPFHETWVQPVEWVNEKKQKVKQCMSTARPYPSFSYFTPTDPAEYWCANKELPLVAVCVSASGLFPRLQDPSQLPADNAP